MLKLNGIDLPSFAKIASIEVSVLPPITNNTIQVRGRKSPHFYDQQLGTRKINATVILLAEEANAVIAKVGQLAEWFYHEEAVPLVISDDPGKTWTVLPDGDTNVEEVVSTGKVTLSFICMEPFAYGPDHEVTLTPIDDEPVYFTVYGNATTYPEIELTLNQDNVDTISVISDDGVIMLGEPNEITKAVTNKKPLRINDDGTNVSLWTAGTTVDSGVVAGVFASDGYSFTAAGNDYGTGADWHGPAMIRSLPSPINNFEVEAWINFNAAKGEEIGRVEIYLLDANNVQFGKVSLHDSYKTGDNPRFLARAGGVSDGKTFADRLDTRSKLWENFYGTIQIGRKHGNVWYCHIGQYDATKKIFHSRYSTEWRDSKNLFNNQLAKVQIHTGVHSTKAKYNKITVNDVEVSEHVELSTTQAPLIGDTGRTFLIDCSRSIVYNEGKPAFDLINPVSKFFGFKKGVNGLSIHPPAASVKITYKERWM